MSVASTFGPPSDAGPQRSEDGVCPRRTGKTADPILADAFESEGSPPTFRVGGQIPLRSAGGRKACILQDSPRSLDRGSGVVAGRSWLGNLSVTAAAAALALMSGCAASSPTAVTLDASLSRPFLGLGAQLWASTEHRPERDAVLKQIGARYVRVSISPGFREKDISGHLSAEEIQALLEKASTTPQGMAASKAADDTRDELNRLRLRSELVVWKAPDAWTVPADKPGRTIDPAFIPDYARLVIAEVRYAQAHGFRPDGVELTNEPYGGWDTLYTPPEYARLVGSVRDLQTSDGLPIHIQGPGAEETTTSGYLRALQDVGALGALSKFSVHIYDHLPLPMLQGFDLGQFSALGGTRPLDVSEFGSVSSSWTNMGVRPGSRGPGEVSSTRLYALASVTEAMQLLADGANSLSFWECEDMPWEHSSFGLIDLDGVSRPSVEALADLFGAAPPRSRVVGWSDPTAGVAVVAFIGRRKVVLALANLSTTDRTIHLALHAFPVPLAHLRLRSRFATTDASQSSSIFSGDTAIAPARMLTVYEGTIADGVPD